jgi:putative hemolysin
METTCSVILTVLWTVVGDWLIIHNSLPGWTLILWEAILVVLLVTFCEIIPKALFAATAERTVSMLAPLTSFLIASLYWLAFILEKIAYLSIRFFTGKNLKPKLTTVTEEDLITMVSVGEDEGVIEEQEREMIHSIFGFGDLVAREIMVPRIDMITLEINASVQEALDLIVEHGHSRIPVYEGSQDHIRGLLYAKDFLRHVEKGDLYSMTTAELIRPDVFFVPGTKDLSSLLEEMQARKAHMVIVMDEYGGTAGIVTIEDILEEIVGEIHDEYDHPSEKPVEKNPDGSYYVDAILGIHDFDDEIGVELPAPEGVETLGGLLYQVLGRVPAVGEIITVEPVAQKEEAFPDDSSAITRIRFKVLEVEENRIGKIQAYLLRGDEVDLDNAGISDGRSEGNTET